MKYWPEGDDARFEREYASSLPAVKAVVAHLIARGASVVLACAENFVTRDLFVDRGGDIIVNGKWKVEVKGRLLDFTCAEDYPYRTVFVDRITKKCGLSDLYVTVSRDLLFGAFIWRPTTEQFWRKTTVTDWRRGYPTLEVFVCPKRLVVFKKLLGQ